VSELFDASGQPTREARVIASAVRRHDGLAAVEANADDDWSARALDVLERWLRTHETFFVDTFWAESGLELPKEARALGPVILKASRAGWMVKTDCYRPSVRSNLTVKPVWRSTLFTSSVAS
jgi:hypothetical protein